MKSNKLKVSLLVLVMAAAGCGASTTAPTDGPLAVRIVAPEHLGLGCNGNIAFDIVWQVEGARGDFFVEVALAYSYETPFQVVASDLKNMSSMTWGRTAEEFTPFRIRVTVRDAAGAAAAEKSIPVAIPRCPGNSLPVPRHQEQPRHAP